MGASRQWASAALVAALICAGAALADGSSSNAPAQSASAPALNPCPSGPSAPVALGMAEWNGWGRDLANSRYQPEPALRAKDVSKLVLRWAYALDGSPSDGQPIVVGGRVFLASSSGRVYSLDARSGCNYWTFMAAAGVDPAMIVGDLGEPKLVKSKWHPWHRWHDRWHRWRRGRGMNAHIAVIEPPSALYFGDDAGTVYALDAETGALLWKVAAGAGLHARVSGSPALSGDSLFVPLTSTDGTRGAVVSMDIATGAVRWETEISRHLIRSDGGTEIAATPTVDTRRGALYIAAGAAGAIVALDLADGKPRWVGARPKKEISPGHGGAAPADGTRLPSSSPPILQTLADNKQILLSATSSGIFYALDPDRDGALLWRTDVVPGAGRIVWSHAADHRNVYVAFANLNPPPGNAAGDGLAALSMATGKIRWLKPLVRPDCSPAGPACAPAVARAVTVIPGIVFCGSSAGHLRAYSTIDGQKMWDYDTAGDYQTQNANRVRGASRGVSGAAVVGGMVYVNSAYHDGQGASGVLLAFSLAEK